MTAERDRHVHDGEWCAVCVERGRAAEHDRLSHLAWAEPVTSMEKVAEREYYRYARMVSEMRDELVDTIVTAIQHIPRGLPDREDLVYRDDVLNEVKAAK